jgi:predicted anti-sigma-YlaC factor YlaD
MSHPGTENGTEQPYSPEALAIMAKARRRAGFSVLIMLIGFMTIAGVVVYRLSTMSGGAETRYAAESVAVPAGADIVSSQVADGLITLTYRLEGATGLRIFDGATGELVREIAVVAD